MNTEGKKIGKAQRVRVRSPFAPTRCAWDCRPFGFGRVVAPIMSTVVEIDNGIQLNLRSGELRAVGAEAALRSSAA